MSNPTVSVIIPVYNAKEGIKQCLDSLLNQSFTDFEIILLNDGSTDNSLEVIKIDIDKHPDLANKYEIMSVPTLLFFFGGELIRRETGFMPEEKILDLIKSDFYVKI